MRFVVFQPLRVLLGVQVVGALLGLVGDLSQNQNCDARKNWNRFLDDISLKNIKCDAISVILASKKKKISIFSATAEALLKASFMPLLPTMSVFEILMKIMNSDEIWDILALDYQKSRENRNYNFKRLIIEMKMIVLTRQVLMIWQRWGERIHKIKEHHMPQAWPNLYVEHLSPTPNALLMSQSASAQLTACQIHPIKSNKIRRMWKNKPASTQMLET